METKTETIRSQAQALGLSNTRNRLEPLLHTAEQKDMTHLEFLEHLLGEEIRCRLDKARDRRINALISITFLSVYSGLMSASSHGKYLAAYIREATVISKSVNQ